MQWIVAKGKVEPFDGDLDDYQRWLLDVSRALSRGQPAPPVPRPAGSEPSAPAAATTPAIAGKGPSRPAPAPQAPREDRKSEKQARAKLAEVTRPKRVELQRIDDRLAKLLKEKAAVEARLADPATKPTAMAELGRELSHVQAEVAMLEERWLELQGELEKLQESS